MGGEGDKAVDIGLQRLLYLGRYLTQRGLVWRK